SVRRLEARGDRKTLLVSEGSGRGAYGVDNWLTKLGVLGQQPHEKRIPGAVFRLGERQIALLLRHLWASAGIVSDRSSIILLPTASPGLACDVAALLLRLGVVARVRAAKHGRVRTTVTVDVSGPAAQLRFLETVGGFGPLAGPVARLATSVAAGRRIG